MPSSEASAGCPYSLHHSSNFSPPTSWHLSSHYLPISVLACPFVFFLLPLQRELFSWVSVPPYKDKTFHEPILRSLNRFVGLRISDSPAIASLHFVTMLFSRADCQPCVQLPAILEERLDCFLVSVFVTDQSGMGGPTSSYATASIAPWLIRPHKPPPPSSRPILRISLKKYIDIIRLGDTSVKKTEDTTTFETNIHPPSYLVSAS